MFFFLTFVIRILTAFVQKVDHFPPGTRFGEAIHDFLGIFLKIYFNIAIFKMQNSHLLSQQTEHFGSRNPVALLCHLLSQLLQSAFEFFLGNARLLGHSHEPSVEFIVFSVSV